MFKSSKIMTKDDITFMVRDFAYKNNCDYKIILNNSKRLKYKIWNYDNLVVISVSNRIARRIDVRMKLSKAEKILRGERK